MIKALKRIFKLSPIPLTKNHRYDIQTRKIIKNLRENSNCIDVGCYIGEILDLILKVSPEGSHFGIEPIPEQYKNLVIKYRKYPNCQIHNFAASNVSGESVFNYVVSNPSFSGLKKRDYEKADEEDTNITVKTELLDNLIPENLRIDFIKIDVEGAELQVLKGAQRMIAQFKPVIVFEHGLGASDHYGTTPTMIYDFFQGKRMKISKLGSFLKQSDSLAKAQFEEQYLKRKNHYFVAHP